MKQYFGLGVGLLVGTVIGAAAVTGLHAQGKPSVFPILRRQSVDLPI